MAPTGRARGWAAIVLVVYSAVAAVILLVPRPIDRGVTPWIRASSTPCTDAGCPSGSTTTSSSSPRTSCCSCRSASSRSSCSVGGSCGWRCSVGVGAGAIVEVGPSFSSDHVASTLDLVLNVVGAHRGRRDRHRDPRGPAKRSARTRAVARRAGSLTADAASARIDPETRASDRPQGASFMVTAVALIIGVVRTSVGPYSPGAPVKVARTSAVCPSCRSTVNFSAGRLEVDDRRAVGRRETGLGHLDRRSSPRRPDRRGRPRCGRSRRGCCRCTRGSSRSAGMSNRKRTSTV